MKKLVLLSLVILLSAKYLVAQGAGGWEVFKSNHFLVFYKNAPQDFIMKVSNKSEEYYSAIAEDLGFSRLNFWSWDDRAKIYIYDDAADYQLQTGQPAWSQGSTTMGQKTVYSYYGAEDFLETTLPHELSHIIFREFVGFNNPAVPLCLDEGVAVLHEKSQYGRANDLLRDALDSNVFMNLTELAGLKSYPSGYGGNNVKLFYIESFSLVDFLVRKMGKDKFVRFCQDLRDKRSFEGALSSSYGFKDLKELNSAWVNYIKNG